MKDGFVRQRATMRDSARQRVQLKAQRTLWEFRLKKERTIRYQYLSDAENMNF